MDDARHVRCFRHVASLQPCIANHVGCTERAEIRTGTGINSRFCFFCCLLLRACARGMDEGTQHEALVADAVVVGLIVVGAVVVVGVVVGAAAAVLL